MPSHTPIHTVRQFVRQFHTAIQGTSLESEDAHTGSSYDLIAGPSAIFWSRLEQRDRDNFRTLYNDTADGQDLTNRLYSLSGIQRFLDSYGTGFVILSRPSTAGGAGTFWTGTRILAQGSALGSAYYAIASAITVGATQTQVMVPINATVYGPGVSIDSTYGATSARLVDASWDNTWSVSAIFCADGTLFEKAKDYLARVRQTQTNNRVGYETDIIQACQAAGAGSVAVFGSNYANNDYGMSAVYVGDPLFNGSTAIVQACRVALESIRVLGADMYVGPMMSNNLTVQATVTLTQDPSLVDTQTLALTLENAVAAQFGAITSGYAFSTTALFGAMQRASNLVQSATWLNVSTGMPLADATVMIGSPPIFPASLTRYSLPLSNIQIAFLATS